jgi:hypothetical protein
VIDEKVAAQICFVFELLDVVPVATGIESPINIAGVVAYSVLAVLGEFNREAVVRASMNAFPEALDDDFGSQLHGFDSHQGDWVYHAGG